MTTHWPQEALANVQCAYCGRRVRPKRITQDHVVPRALFTDRSESAVKVPACGSCNREKARHEGDLRDYLVMDSFGSKHAVAQEIMGSTFIRAVRRNQSPLARTVMKHGRPVRVRTASGIYLPNHVMSPIDGTSVGRALEYIVRGLYFHFMKSCVPGNYVVNTGRIVDRQTIEELLSKYRAVPNSGPYRMGEGVFGCYYLRDRVDPCTTAWFLWFYDGVYVVAGTESREEADRECGSA